MTDCRVIRLLAEFRAQHEQLHREWTAAVGTLGYVKAPWRDRDNALVREYGDRLKAFGYDGPLAESLPYAVDAPRGTQPEPMLPAAWRALTDEQRLELMALCCRHCGTMKLPCYCGPEFDQ